MPILSKLLLTLALSLSFQGAYGKDFLLSGKIERVMDGDTVQIVTTNLSKVKVRLLGIDAPESNQFFGPESKQHLISLSQSKTVTAQCIGFDKYKRSLCKIVANEVDLNLEQLKSGMAWHYKAYVSTQSNVDQISYAAAEISARDSRIGLWSSGPRESPWDYRKGATSREGSGSDSDESGLVKMSRSKICHKPDSRYYVATTNYRSFASIGDCLKSGGRLPRSR